MNIKLRNVPRLLQNEASGLMNIKLREVRQRPQRDEKRSKFMYINKARHWRTPRSLVNIHEPAPLRSEARAACLRQARPKASQC